MTRTIILCTDGSHLAIDAVREGLNLLKPGDRTVLVTVNEPPDPSLVVGASGFAGGTVSPDTFDELQAASAAAADEVLEATTSALGSAVPDGLESHILVGSPGAAVCAYAIDVDASAIVVGSRGNGGLKRAVLGSVSDHIVRHAHCAVLIYGKSADTADES